MTSLDVPHDPADRPHRRRQASRVLVIDREEHLLLFRDSDLGLDPVPHWWVTPGGGVDPGESDVEAAVRELREETGLVTGADALVGPVATRAVLHGFSDHITTQEEIFFAVWVDRFTPDASEQTEEELACFVGHGWFSAAEVHGLEEPVWPADVVDLWAHATAMRLDPSVTGLELPPVEESTVPAGEGTQPA